MVVIIIVLKQLSTKILSISNSLHNIKIVISHIYFTEKIPSQYIYIIIQKEKNMTLYFRARVDKDILKMT